MSPRRVSGPEPFAKLLRDSIDLSRKSANQIAAEVDGISSQGLRDWTRLTAESEMPTKAKWPVIEDLERALELPRGALWLALTGESPLPTKLNVPDGLDVPTNDQLRMVHEAIQALAGEVRRLSDRFDQQQQGGPGAARSRRSGRQADVAAP